MKYVVNIPVCDLRREPSIHVKQYTKDLLQESQLLYGECLLAKEIQGDWLCVEALEQKKYSKEGQWIGYPGWVKLDQVFPVEEFPHYNLVVSTPWVDFGSIELSFGTYLKGVKRNEKTWTIALPDKSYREIDRRVITEFVPSHFLSLSSRLGLMERGICFLENPYLWGGRSAFKKNCSQITSIDCSGLSNLLYRFQGIEIARDAHDQRLQCKEIEYEDLQPADFIFTADIGHPERIRHVMLFKQDDIMLEASLDADCVRYISGEEKLGKSLSKIKSGENVGKFIVWFGAYIER